MNPSITIRNILNQHPDTLSAWEYESPMDIPHGIVFSVSCTFNRPRWVKVTYDDAEGAYVVRTLDKRNGIEQEIGFVLESDLLNVLDNVIREGVVVVRNNGHLWVHHNQTTSRPQKRVGAKEANQTVMNPIEF